jgi:hypothetical protein
MRNEKKGFKNEVGEIYLPSKTDGVECKKFYLEV